MFRQQGMPLEAGIIGFGAFGQLAARHLVGPMRLWIYDCAWQPGCKTDVPGLIITSLAEAASRPIVVLAVPVSALEEVVAAIVPYLQPGAMVLDVGSVKVNPAEIMRAGLPPSVEIVATHPLFGPQSAVNGIEGLKVALCPVRGRRWPLVVAFLRRLGLQVVMTTADEHDRECAIAQGLTHLIAQLLKRMEPLPRKMTTPSFDLLMRGLNMVRHDAPEVLNAIERANPYASDVRERFFTLVKQIEQSYLSDGISATERQELPCL